LIFRFSSRHFRHAAIICFFDADYRRAISRLPLLIICQQHARRAPRDVAVTLRYCRLIFAFIVS
jgi:hypothetical protein